MNARLARTTLAIASVVIASIVIGGTIVLVGDLAYRWLAAAASPGVALICLVSGSLGVSGVIFFLGQYALRQAIRRPHTDASLAPEQMIVGELIKAANANPGKLVIASLGVGFALGLSPRLRRVVYRTIIG